MKKITLFILGLLVSGLANASLITSGNIQQLGNDQSSIDYWGFATSGGTLIMDLLSWEEDYSMGVVTDVNGDGEIAFVDTYIYLMRDDGDLTADDFINRNDDTPSTVGTDGTLHSHDSYLSEDLSAGNYLLAVGASALTLDEVISGINSSSFYPMTCTGKVGENCGSLLQTDHGDYQITWTGDIQITRNPDSVFDVPEPGSLALMGLGLIGLVASRKSRKI